MKKFMSTPIATVALFALAVLLLGFGGVNAIQAAPRLESGDYRAQVQLSDINVAIVENENVLPSDAELLTELKEELNKNNEKIQLGRKYDDVLSVRNTNRPDTNKTDEGIPEYVRVSVYCYWTDGDDKAVNLNPGYIKPNFLDTEKDPQSKWVIDKDASTPERTVLYYKDILPVGETTDPFADGFTIDSAVATAVANGEYQYDKNNGVSFHIKVTADAVQTHNGTDAMISAWGRTNE